MDKNPIVLFIRLSRPFYILIGVILYFLGGGIVRYLGEPIDWNIFLLGLFWVLFMQLSAIYLNEFFAENLNIDGSFRSPFSAGTGTLGPGKLSRQVALWAALVALTIAASLTVLIIRDGRLTLPSMLVIILIVTGVIFYSIPPIRLAASGYGELVITIIMSNLLPAYALLLQTGEFHRLLAMVTFPLAALHLAMIIAFGLSDFGKDIKSNHPTLLVRMGWRDGMNMHNLLILSAYLLLGLATTFGLPVLIVIPALLPLPIGLFQIWQMIRIGAGAKPNWRVLHVSAVALFTATVYLLTFGFWTR